MTINKVGQSPFYTEGEQAAIAFGAPGACSAPTPAIFFWLLLLSFLIRYECFCKVTTFI